MENVDPTWRAVLNRNTAVIDEKKRQIIEATIHLVAKNGIGFITFDHLGQELGTTKANIKYHFADKDELIFTATRLVVINAQMITAQLVEKALEPEDKLMAMIDGAYTWFQNYPEHVIVWLLFMYYAQIHPPYSKFYTETRSVGQGRMQLLLRALPHTKAKNLNYLQLAELLQNFMYGQFLGLLGQSEKELRRSKRDTIQAIGLLLKARGIDWSHAR
jgi:AcrR family transcriptional regulator